MSTSSGWHSDPTGRHEHRYWDGGSWSDHVADAGVVGHDELAGSDRTPTTSSGYTTPANARLEPPPHNQGLTLGHRVKPDKAGRWLQSLRPVLLTGEEVHVLIKGATAHTNDLIVITNARALALESATWSVKTELVLGDVVEVRREYSMRGKSVLVKMRNGEKVRFVPHQMAGDGDTELLRVALTSLSAQAPALQASDSLRENEARRAAEAARLSEAERGLWPGTVVIGSHPRKKAAKAILAHCRGGETPWLIIGSPGAGVLAAFEDRLVLTKTGLVTSATAGSLGGERTATFDFHHVTGLEYNSGLLNGVLEILTPSYNGTANRDYWRGTGRSRNADSNDPFTLSNTLPLDKATYRQALPHLNDLRERIAASRTRPTAVTVSLSPDRLSGGMGLADEISRLKQLHDDGALSDEEFAAAKTHLLGGRG